MLFSSMDQLVNQVQQAAVNQAAADGSPTTSGGLTPPPAPWVPPPNVQTPPQASTSGLMPIPGNTPINSVSSQPTKGAPALTVPASSIAPTTGGGTAPSKGFGKGPSNMQIPAQANTAAMPGTAGNPMDFHTQLQDFINTGLLGGSQRLQG